MKKFYICSGDQPKGPYTINKLLEHGIEETDFIWCEGFKQSKLAIDIEELQVFFHTTESPGASIINGYETTVDEVISPAQKEKKKYMVLFVCASIVVILMVIYYCVAIL